MSIYNGWSARIPSLIYKMMSCSNHYGIRTQGAATFWQKFSYSTCILSPPRAGTYVYNPHIGSRR